MNLTSLLIPASIMFSAECHPAENKLVVIPDDYSVTSAAYSVSEATDIASSYDVVSGLYPEEEKVCRLCRPDSWRISTNALAWGMAVANAGVECELAPRWSVALSVYYSGWNYLKETRKFRTFTVRPEARYWFSPGHRGLFAEGHLGLAYYNFALPSWSYRIQDRDGKHPALGGGIGVGYRLPLRNPRWAVEAQVGAGVYHLSYDRFENRPDGPLHDTRSKTWFGIDNVTIGISFNLR